MSGRANVISDKEFRDKNKALTTSNQQKHGEEYEPLVFSVSKEFFPDFHFAFPFSVLARDDDLRTRAPG